MANKNDQELTASGHKFDKDLARVKIKVSPPLQALIANQLDLIELIEKNLPDEHIFIEQHKSELFLVEEEISQAFAAYMVKREADREKRAQKKQVLAQEQMAQFESEANSFIAMESSDTNNETDLPWEENPVSNSNFSSKDYDITSDADYPDNNFDPLENLDRQADKISPGLPSEKYEQRQAPVEKQPEIDVRRVAIGASIKALVDFLGRELTEEEIVNIEKQVDSYLS